MQEDIKCVIVKMVEAENFSPKIKIDITANWPEKIVT